MALRGRTTSKRPHEETAAKLKENYEEDVAACRAKGRLDEAKTGVTTRAEEAILKKGR